MVTSTRALATAVARSQHSRVESLLANGADPNGLLDLFRGPDEPDAADDMGLAITPLFGALAGRNLTGLERLLQAGANPLAADGSALSWAVRWCDQEALARLLGALPADRGAAPALVAELALRSLPLLADLQRTAFIELIAQDRLPTISFEALQALDRPAAAATGDGVEFAILGALLSTGFAIDALHEDQSARDYASSRGDVLFAQALAAKGAERPRRWTAEGEVQTQFAAAAAAGNAAGIAKLLEDGVSPNAAGPGGVTALEAAVASGAEGAALQLLDAGAALPAGRQTDVLSGACRRGLSAVTARLLPERAAVNAHDGQGGFPLRNAVRVGSPPLVRALLDAGADPNFADTEGRTALHYLTRLELDGASEDAPWRQLTEGHFAAADLLIAAGFRFTSLDNAGVDVLASNIAKPLPMFVSHLLECGAPPGARALLAAAENQNVPALEALLRLDGVAELLTGEMLLAARRGGGWEPAVVLLLRRGCPFPEEAYDLGFMLEDAARVGPEVISAFLDRGPLPAEALGAFLAAAIQAGRSDLINLALDRGIDPDSPTEGGSALHFFLRKDLQRDDGNPSILWGPQKQAISLLISRGLDINKRDRQGDKPMEIAREDPVTLAAYVEALALVPIEGTDLHAAARAGDLAKARIALENDPEVLNAPDGLGRSALTLALQTRHTAVAKFLLRAGAQLKLEATSLQLSDLEYSQERDLLASFYILLLSQQILDLPGAYTRSQMEAAMATYESGNKLQLPAMTWKINAAWRINLRVDPNSWTEDREITGEGDLSPEFPIYAGQATSDRQHGFSLTQLKLGAHQVKQRYIIGSGIARVERHQWVDVRFAVSSTLRIEKIPGTERGPVSAPGLRIYNPNLPGAYPLPVTDGSERRPGAELEIRQAGRTFVIPPDKTLILDRTLGNAEVGVGLVTARVFHLGLRVELLAGPPLPRTDRPSPYHRLQTYSALIELRRQLDEPPADDLATVQQKAIRAAIAAGSAACVAASWHELASNSLWERIEQVSQLNLELQQLQAAVLAAASLSPEQIDQMLRDLDRLGGVQDGGVVDGLRRQLRVMRDAAGDADEALQRLKDLLLHRTDTVVEWYQAAILEFAQYMSDTQLENLLEPFQRETVRQRLSGQNLMFSDAALDGRGARLRDYFGLPA